MGVRRYDELIAWQLADAFKRDVFALVQESESAWRDFRYRSQILDAASAVGKDIAEGFLRYSPADFSRFLSYALGSLGEAEGRLLDGVELRYFSREECAPALVLAKRCFVALVRLKQSQRR